MRCGCPECGTLMIHVESGEHLDCCCPVCGVRCRACLGTDSVLSKADIEAFRSGRNVARILELEQAVTAPDEDGDDPLVNEADMERSDRWIW